MKRNVWIVLLAAILMAGLLIGVSGAVADLEVDQTSDGGYIIVGEKRSRNHCLVWLIKTDKNGTEVWDRIIGENSCWEYKWSAKQTSDGGYIIKGVNSSGHERIIKTDKNGIKQVTMLNGLNSNYEEWNETLRGDTWAYYCLIKQTSDGGYISKGYLNYIQERQIYRVDLVIKIDANGSEEWRTVSAPIGIPQTKGNSQTYTSTPQLEPSPKPTMSPTPTPTPVSENIVVVVGDSAPLPLAKDCTIYAKHLYVNDDFYKHYQDKGASNIENLVKCGNDSMRVNLHISTYTWFTDWKTQVNLSVKGVGVFFDSNRKKYLVSFEDAREKYTEDGMKLAIRLRVKQL
jgi:hypothetical protein